MPTPFIAAAGKFVKGAAVYVEGRLTLDKWKTTGGEDRSGLSVMSWHCRLAQIGRNKVKRKNGVSVAAGTAAPAQTAQAPGELDDAIPF